MNAEPDLRRAIEEAYERIRSALARKDFEAFRELVDPAPSSSDAWDEMAAELADSFPPLGETRFAAARQVEDWAGYYFETDLGDREYATLELIRFRRVGTDWKLSGGPVAAQFERTGDPGALLAEIRDDPFLKLPCEPGYEEE